MVAAKLAPSEQNTFSIAFVSLSYASHFFLILQAQTALIMSPVLTKSTVTLCQE